MYCKHNFCLFTMKVDYKFVVFVIFLSFPVKQYYVSKFSFVLKFSWALLIFESPWMYKEDYIVVVLVCMRGEFWKDREWAGKLCDIFILMCFGLYGTKDVLEVQNSLKILYLTWITAKNDTLLILYSCLWHIILFQEPCRLREYDFWNTKCFTQNGIHIE